MDMREALERASKVYDRNEKITLVEQSHMAEQITNMVRSPGWEILKDNFADKIFSLSRDLLVDFDRANEKILYDFRVRKTQAQAYLDIINFAERLAEVITKKGDRDAKAKK